MNIELQNKIHERNFILLKTFDLICRKNDIPYFVAYGTLLGAVRHQDFIPWDDDVDVWIFQEDYARLSAILRDEWQEQDELEWIEYDKLPGFWDMISRISFRNSRRHASSDVDFFYDNRQNKISLDIFVLNKIPEGKWGFRIINFFRSLYYGLSLGRRYRLCYKHFTWLQTLVVFVLSLTGKLIPLSWIFSSQNSFLRRLSKIDSTRIISYNCPAMYFHQKDFDKSWFEPIELTLHGLSVFSPKNYHEVLTTLYGDYMQLPPESQRLPSHSSAEEIVF